MSFEYLMDGCCCAAVLVKKPAAEVAAALGDARTLIDGTCVSRELVPEPLARVARFQGDTWSVVEYRQDETAAVGYDSAPLVEQAIAASRGTVPAAPFDFTAPVTLATSLSGTLGCEAIGLWGSDQGPGIGGAAFAASGRLQRVLSAASPELLELIVALREREDDAADDADLERLEEYGTSRTFCWTAGEGSSELAGPVAEHVDAAVVAAGATLESFLDPLWAYERALADLEIGQESATFREWVLVLDKTPR